jgi:hypothetical protein
MFPQLSNNAENSACNTDKHYLDNLVAALMWLIRRIDNALALGKNLVGKTLARKILAYRGVDVSANLKWPRTEKLKLWPIRLAYANLSLPSPHVRVSSPESRTNRSPRPLDESAGDPAGSEWRS